MTQEKRRYDAPRPGAVRFCVIVDHEQVKYLKTFAKQYKIRITDLVGDCFAKYIDKLERSKKTD
jgi:hypothetical protein